MGTVLDVHLKQTVAISQKSHNAVQATAVASAILIRIVVGLRATALLMYVLSVQQILTVRVAVVSTKSVLSVHCLLIVRMVIA